MKAQVDLQLCIDDKAMKNVAMPLYKCHKEVHALPLTRGSYNHARGWDIPSNEDPTDNGYLTCYNRGSVDEYVSWSPEHIFDAGYALVSTDEPNYLDSSPIITYFKYAHLPTVLQEVSKPIGDLARLMDGSLVDGPEKDAGLRKLLEAKDCFVRAKLA